MCACAVINNEKLAFVLAKFGAKVQATANSKTDIVLVGDTARDDGWPVSAKCACSGGGRGSRRVSGEFWVGGMSSEARMSGTPCALVEHRLFP